MRSRFLYEKDLERRAMDSLRAAPRTGSIAAISEADSLLTQAVTRPVAQEVRARVFELAEALFQSVRMQLSVERYHATAVDRGANLDRIDFPLNDHPWLEDRFAAIRALASEPERLKMIDEIVNWTNPGPGGFYDDLGDPANSPHLVRGKTLAEDPGGHDSVRIGFEDEGGRPAWSRHAETLWDTPLEVGYRGLDPFASYRVRAVYAGDSPEKPIRLVANEGIEIHPYMPKPVPIRPLEFDIPRSATSGGTLTLRWYGVPGVGRNGRGCQVSEVWLIRR